MLFSVFGLGGWSRSVLYIPLYRMPMRIAVMTPSSLVLGLSMWGRVRRWFLTVCGLKLSCSAMRWMIHPQDSGEYLHFPRSEL